jgi:type IV secretory pathway VirB4 component
MADPVKIPIRASTQEHLEVEDIKDDLVLMKDGSCCLIIVVTAINFSLLSEREQDATIYAYASLLNSLTFPVQIVVRSQKKDVTSYLKLLDREIARQSNKLLRDQIKRYHKFVEEIVRKNEVLDKEFYVVIPFSTLEMGVGKTITSVARPKKGLPFEKNYILEKAKIALIPKRDHLSRLLRRLGLKSRQLNTQELIQLFYQIYNPEVEGQRFAPSQEYTTPMVQPAVGKTEEQKTENQTQSSQGKTSKEATT